MTLDVGKDEYGNLVLRYVGAIHLFCCVRTVLYACAYGVEKRQKADTESAGNG